MEDLVRDSGSFLGVEGLLAWGLAVLIALLITSIVKIALTAILARLKKLTSRSSSEWDDLIVDTLMATRAAVIFIWAFIPMLPALNVHSSVLKAGHTIGVLATALQVLMWGFRAIHHWRRTFLAKRAETDASSVAALGLLVTAIQFLLVIAILLVGLSNLGIDVGALVAGLGVGGIAIALAAQNVLGDLLASLSIVLDKPFVVGDFITVGQQMGTVENIGLKTTRLRSLSGEELVLSNKDLLESRIQNYKRMWQRRVVQKFGVTYNTPAEKLDQIPKWVRAIVETEDKAKYDRCHLMSYGGSSLDYELVFNVLDSEYNVFADIQQRVLIAIFKKFADEKVEFAFPTQTLFIEKMPVLSIPELVLQSESPNLPA